MNPNSFGKIVSYMFMAIFSFLFLSRLVAGESGVLPAIILLVFFALAKTYSNRERIEGVADHA